jgi:hypothetical protein
METKQSSNHLGGICVNIHSDCENYNPKKDFCLKWFEENVSRLTECKEKTTFSDKELSRKWSN